tara:strand:+ start:160 stop:696 length:537 start_codon:yes stop_codon:yes gene_type:complete
MTIEITLPDNKGEQIPQDEIKIDLNVRRSLDGNYLIFDHIDMDIVVMPEKNKIVTFPKESLSDVVYGAQNRMFDYLTKKGIVLPETVQGGNVYGALEAAYPDSTTGYDADKVVMLSISKFIDEERPYFAYDKAYQQQEIDRLVDPEEEDSTELGEVPHKAQKGSMDKHARGKYIPGYF